ncbi:maleylacetoacetate isomerase [Terasakiella sp. A23]|uniref:maleylacetoacetate isomerase n=1 Tax=Terasakiella sp. FCG-A23 TaxID=3080561 RepID=UPI002953C348|nr:maleylacetoacetate isomerase [Terasakiella sp. A23]MDV7340590.1 maleylacetoacetate isomerase [Terasakiella sp. A23]
MKLFTYWRSSAAYRVRIGLNLKETDFESIYVHLVKDGGEQLTEAYRAINPQALVPSIELPDGQYLTQSMAILEYLDETLGGHDLLPADALDRAYVRALSQSVACEIHPLNNLRVLKYLSTSLKVTDEDKSAWYRHWVEVGLHAFEETLIRTDKMGDFCFGDKPSLADICLVPQVYNARRFNVDLTPYPHIIRIDKNCQSLEAFAKAAPEQQGDAV